jgi:hypothetical protein
MADWLVFAPGVVLLLGGIVVTFLGYASHSSARALAGIRLRFVGIALLLILPGIQLAMIGLMNGPRWGQIALGLIVMGFGALWIVGANGIRASRADR